MVFYLFEFLYSISTTSDSVTWVTGAQGVDPEPRLGWVRGHETRPRVGSVHPVSRDGLEGRTSTGRYTQSPSDGLGGHTRSPLDRQRGSYSQGHGGHTPRPTGRTGDSRVSTTATKGPSGVCGLSLEDLQSLVVRDPEEQTETTGPSPSLEEPQPETVVEPETRPTGPRPDAPGPFVSLHDG